MILTEDKYCSVCGADATVWEGSPATGWTPYCTDCFDAHDEEATPVSETLAHNTARSGPNQDVPVIIEDSTDFPFAPGEREGDWHVASDDEYQAYLTYWNAIHDEDGYVFPQGPEDALLCTHGTLVWRGHECGECEAAGTYIWQEAPVSDDEAPYPDPAEADEKDQPEDDGAAEDLAEQRAEARHEAWLHRMDRDW